MKVTRKLLCIPPYPAEHRDTILLGLRIGQRFRKGIRPPSGNGAQIGILCNDQAGKAGTSPVIESLDGKEIRYVFLVYDLLDGIGGIKQGLAGDIGRLVGSANTQHIHVRADGSLVDRLSGSSA